MNISILTLFPEMFRGPLDESIVKSARERGLVDVDIVDIRDFTSDRHRTADDYPFGGGPGMVMKPEPVFRAVESVLGERSTKEVPVILISPQGRRLDHRTVRRLAGLPGMVLICGRYKGVDERIREHLATEEISIGDFVISGGELAAMVVVDAVTRLQPGALGDLESAETDTFYEGLLEHANYTRPREFRGHAVPEVLLSGDHEAVRRWRRRSSLKKTMMRRPDLLEAASLTEEDLKSLESMRSEEIN
jgi:tRNA (guanine37-N1)-methyltransferase